MMCFLQYKIGFTPFCFSVPDLTKGSETKAKTTPGQALRFPGG
jgi:hypothetical protein